MGSIPIRSRHFSRKGEQRIRSLGTEDEGEAEKIKDDVDAQLDRIRRGQSSMASRLLAEGFDILDVLFGSSDVAARLDVAADNNPLTMKVLTDDDIKHLKSTVQWDQHYISDPPPHAACE